MSKVSLELAEKVRDAILSYNRYRSPESRAILLRMDGCKIKVRFEGTFCETCGLNDWLIDFKYVLEDNGLPAELIEIIEPENDIWNIENWRIGVYKITGDLCRD